MSQSRTCNTCEAFSPLTSECRRKSPVAIFIPTPHGGQAAGIYPATKKDGWCCEWVIRVEFDPCSEPDPERQRTGED